LVVVVPVEWQGCRMYLTNRIGKLLLKETASQGAKEERSSMREVSISPYHGDKLLRAYGGCLGAKCR
jgi:hypothetical protein